MTTLPEEASSRGILGVLLRQARESWDEKHLGARCQRHLSSSVRGLAYVTLSAKPQLSGKRWLPLPLLSPSAVGLAPGAWPAVGNGLLPKGGAGANH